MAFEAFLAVDETKRQLPGKWERFSIALSTFECNVLLYFRFSFF